MNKTLKQAIFKKRMLQNKYIFCKSSKNWENFRKQRNFVTKLRRKSINKYFIDRCTGDCKSSNFWPTVKPFLTNKGCYKQKDTILCEEDILITDQQKVCTVFNDFFVNVAKDIGNNSINVDDSHPSIKSISNIVETCESQSQFNFNSVNEIFISKQIDKLCAKKATGQDGISSKLLKLAKPSITGPITSLVNKSFTTSIFPDSLKIAQVKPLHKKKSTMDKGN